MKKTSEELKNLVQSKYNLIAEKGQPKNASNACCSGKDRDLGYSIFSEDYSNIEGYQPEADLSLGCGVPTELAKMKPGDTVLDLGSGAGNDCFVARAIVGKTGRVIGLDFANKMLEKANENVKKIGYSNVSFVKGDIENIPLNEKTVNVVISNCVLNLVPNKKEAFKQIFKVLQPGGHFAVSDIVLVGEFPEKLRDAAYLYAGCVSGALQKDEYLNTIEEAGFKHISVSREKEITIPNDILLQILSLQELKDFKTSGTKIFSITVYGEKGLEPKNC